MYHGVDERGKSFEDKGKGMTVRMAEEITRRARSVVDTTCQREQLHQNLDRERGRACLHAPKMLEPHTQWAVAALLLKKSPGHRIPIPCLSTSRLYNCFTRSHDIVPFLCNVLPLGGR